MAGSVCLSAILCHDNHIQMHDLSSAFLDPTAARVPRRQHLLMAVLKHVLSSDSISRSLRCLSSPVRKASSPIACTR